MKLSVSYIMRFTTFFHVIVSALCYSHSHDEIKMTFEESLGAIHGVNVSRLIESYDNDIDGLKNEAEGFINNPKNDPFHVLQAMKVYARLSGHDQVRQSDYTQFLNMASKKNHIRTNDMLKRAVYTSLSLVGSQDALASLEEELNGTSDLGTRLHILESARNLLSQDDPKLSEGKIYVEYDPNLGTKEPFIERGSPAGSWSDTIGKIIEHKEDFLKESRSVYGKDKVFKQMMKELSHDMNQFAAIAKKHEKKKSSVAPQQKFQGGDDQKSNGSGEGDSEVIKSSRNVKKTQARAPATLSDSEQEQKSGGKHKGLVVLAIFILMGLLSVIYVFIKKQSH